MVNTNDESLERTISSGDPLIQSGAERALKPHPPNNGRQWTSEERVRPDHLFGELLLFQDHLADKSRISEAFVSSYREL